MKRPLLLSLVLCAPLGYFLGFYLDGWRVIPKGSGFLIAAASMFLLPFAVSLLLATLCTKPSLRRNLVLFGTLILQFILIFALVPPGARSEMIGVGHRFRNAFQPAEIRACAKSILERYQRGILTTNAAPSYLRPPITQATTFVAVSELPANLQEKFRHVGIDASDRNSRVIFEVESQVGIIYGKKLGGSVFSHYELADDLCAYRYERP